MGEVDTCSRLISLIRAQLHLDIATSGIDVGYVNGTNVVSIEARMI